MKWVFYVIVFVYMFYRAVYGKKTVDNIIIGALSHGEDGFLKVGEYKTISCKASDKSKVDWIDPNNNVVKRLPAGRVYAQEHLSQTIRGRDPALQLTFTKVAVEDTGVYWCRSGDQAKNVSVCVIDPTEFVDTPTEVSTDAGRSITLSCQAKGEPEPRLVWSRNNEVISDEDSSSKFKVMTKYNMEGFESLLTVSSLSPPDSGVYSCQSIQDSPKNDKCTYTKTMNITLNVNHAPMFDVGNETYAIVYGRNNEQVQITCSAAAYPAATYRLFRDMGKNTMYEFEKNQIEFPEEENAAVLTVVAGPATYDHVFKCLATNDYGEATKYFVVKKTEKPSKPDELEVSDAIHTAIWLTAGWKKGITFPIDEMHIQYLQAKSEKPPGEVSWRRSTQIGKLIEKAEIAVVEDGEVEGLNVAIDELVPETNYWFRVRVKNSAGTSQWSNAVYGSTLSAASVENEITTTENSDTTSSEDEETQAEASSFDDTSTTTYGIFFGGGILVVAFVCMFAMRMVR